MSLVPEPSQTATANESLATTLTIGNISGANDIQMSAPQKIEFAGDISLKNGVGGQVVIDQIPLNAGPALNTAVFFEPATNTVVYQNLAPTSETLAQTLALGNTSGANSIYMDANQSIDFDGDIRLTNNRGGTGIDFIVQNIPPNLGAPITETLVYDTTTGQVLTQTPFSDSLAGTLATGNTTGANDIVVSAPQKIDFAGDISIVCGAGNDVLIDTIPANTGPSLTDVVYYNPTTKQVLTQTLSPSSEDLTQTLTIGNTTGPNNIVVSAGQQISYVGDIQLSCGAGNNVVINQLPQNTGAPFNEVQYNPANNRLYYAPLSSQVVPTVCRNVFPGYTLMPVSAGATTPLNIGFGSAIGQQMLNGIPQYPNAVWLFDLNAFQMIWTQTANYNNNDTLSFVWSDGVNSIPLNTPPLNQTVLNQTPPIFYPTGFFRIGSLGKVPFPVNTAFSLGMLPNLTTLNVTNNSGSTMTCGTFTQVVYAEFLPNGITI